MILEDNHRDSPLQAAAISRWENEGGALRSVGRVAARDVRDPFVDVPFADIADSEELQDGGPRV